MVEFKFILENDIGEQLVEIGTATTASDVKQYVNSMIEECDLMNCFRCGSQLTTDPDQVTKGYAAACLNCDEDFYTFEIHGE